MQEKSLQNIISFIWSVANECLRDHYVKGKYRDVILPMCAITRLDSLLSPTHEAQLKAYEEYKDFDADYIKSYMQEASGYDFYNSSKFTLTKLKNDPHNLKANFENYLDGFSDDIKDIIKKFKFYTQLDTMADAGILYSVLDKFTDPKIDLSPYDAKTGKGLSNHDMGYVYEELIRRFNEENNEEAGEHFTPREIVRLMGLLLFTPLKLNGYYSLYDHACGTGGMLSESKNYLENELKSTAKFDIYGQEVNAETYALCKADMLIKGENIENIAWGSTLSADAFAGKKFNFMLANPPYGKDWGNDMKLIGAEKRSTNDPRFFTHTNKSDLEQGFIGFTS